MRKLPQGIRKDEALRMESLSQSQKGDLLDSSCLEIDLLETGVLSPITIEASVEKLELPEDRTGQEKFDQFLGEAIDEALSSLGEPVKNAVYQHLQNDFSIEKNQIPSKIDEFSDIIHKIFGLGASRLEIKFMKNLNSKIEANIRWSQYEWPLSKWIIVDLSFKQFVYNARKKYLAEYEKTLI